MLNLGVKLSAKQDHDGGDPHPHHHTNGGAKRAVGRIVCPEIGDVPGEENRADQPRVWVASCLIAKRRR